MEIREQAARGSYIRRAGEDVIVGDVVVRSGTLLSSRQLAVIAAVGKGHLAVYPRPRGRGCCPREVNSWNLERH